MANYYTVTGNLGGFMPPGTNLSSLVVVVTTNLDGPVVDRTGNRVALGDVEVPVQANGDISVSLLQTDSADTNVSGWSYWLNVSHRTAISKVDGRGATRGVARLGPFPLTKNSTLAELSVHFDTPAVDPTWRDGFRAEMETLRDDVAAITEPLTAPANEQVASYVATPGATKDALSAEIVGETAQKSIYGGRVPKPVRAPHLVVEDTYPNTHAPRSVIWAEPSGLMYASGSDQGLSDRSLWKSTDHGRNWTHVSTPPAIITQSTFLRLATGTLLGYNGASIFRSVDDGVTWTNVHTLRANCVIMGMNSWTEDGNGHVYYGEYQVTDTGFTEIRVYRSTDDGATFTVFHTFPGPATSDPARIRHVHAVQGDPLDGRRIYVMTGDSETAAGVYRVNAAGTALEKVVDNAQLAGLGTTLARSIGMMFFSTHLAWGVDATESPLVVRMNRSQIGAPAPVAQIVYRINATAWWVARAATDSSKWIMSASKEGLTTIDNAVHVYALEDNGATIYEVGSLPQSSAAPSGSVAAIGRPELHGDRMWLASYNVQREGGLPSRYQIAARLAYGAAPIPLTSAPRTPQVLAWQTCSSGQIAAMTSAQVLTIGVSKAGGLRRKLLIHDWAVHRTSGAQVATLQVYNATSSTVLWSSDQTGTQGSKRASAPVRDGDPYIVDVGDIAGSNTLEFRVVASGAGGFAGVAQITYGWAESTP